MANVLKLRLARKVRDSAFMLSLSIGSFIGFIINTYTWFMSGVNSFQWLSVVLGLGLIFEGKIQQVVKKKNFDGMSIPKIITLAIGVIVLVGGLMTLPLLQHLLTDKIIGAIGIFNVIAVVVIGAEIFLID